MECLAVLKSEIKELERDYERISDYIQGLEDSNKNLEVEKVRFSLLAPRLSQRKGVDHEFPSLADP